MTAVRLRELLLFLNKQTKASFQGNSVDAYLTKNEIEIDDLIPFSRFREDTYARNLIHRTELYELFVLAWLPGHKAGIHDHAGSRCWMTMGLGELAIQDFHPVDSEECIPKPKGKPSQFDVGDTLYIDDRIGLHSIANASTKPALSMHLYAAPLTHCRVFDEKLRRFKQVALECFPPPPEAEWNTEHPLVLE